MALYSILAIFFNQLEFLRAMLQRVALVLSRLLQLQLLHGLWTKRGVGFYLLSHPLEWLLVSYSFPFPSF
nr:hypothetical protein Iba_scaffold38221CG0030 [Ipomoea batatas]